MGLRAPLTCLTEHSRKLPTTQKAHLKNALESSFYDDDDLGGGNSLGEASQLIKDVRDKLLAYSFTLRKWCSSRPELINDLTCD